MPEATVNDTHFKVVGTVSEQRAANGEIYMTAIPKPVRFQRGLRNLLICFGAMIIGVFIPILHFVLVPGFFFLGIFLF